MKKTRCFGVQERKTVARTLKEWKRRLMLSDDC